MADLKTLIASREDASARSALGAEWERRSPPLTCRRDVPPLREAPVIQWKTELEGRDPIRGILASPLGVVVCTSKRLLVLDADSGEVRFELPKVGGYLVSGDVLLVVPPTRVVTGYDLWTGERLHETKVKGQKDAGQVAGGRFVTTGSSSAVGYRLEDPRAGLVELWKEPGSYTLVTPHIVTGQYAEWPLSWSGSVVTDPYTLLCEREGGGELHVIGPEGERVTTVAGGHCVFGDGRGFVTYVGERNQGRRAYVALPSGERRWELPSEFSEPFALTARSVIVANDAALIALDRETGAEIARASLPTQVDTGKVWVCRDAAYTASSWDKNIAAISPLQAEPLWVFDTQRKISEYPSSLYPMLEPGYEALYVALDSKRVLRLAAG